MFEFPEIFYFNINKIVDYFMGRIQYFFGGFFSFIEMVFEDGIFPELQHFLNLVPWWVYIVLVFIASWRLYNVGMGVVLSLLLFAIGSFQLWDSMILTLSIIIVSVFFSLIIGIPTGIMMAKSSVLEKILKPLLDGMQTMPSFVYLIPVLLFFRVGYTPAVIATTIYAVPPLIRLTYLGIRNVNAEIIEAGESFGSTPMQMLFKIELPQALSTIATGVNQTTMMAVAMIVIASMIGARGLGADVLRAVRQVDVGMGVQTGLAVVFVAIILDRLLQGVANKFETRGDTNG